MARLKPFFPLSYGVPRVDDSRVLSGVIFLNRTGLRWRDAPLDYGPHKTHCNRWLRWSQMGVFVRILQELVSPGKHIHHVFKTPFWRSVMKLDSDNLLRPLTAQ